MTKKERALLAVEALKNKYPDSICSLNAENPLQLIIATRLSAQCTDARVNLVTPALFSEFPSISDFSRADVRRIEELIHSCGFFRQKAKDIVGMAQEILTRFDGVVPDTIENLITLPGVGRKSANLIMGDVFGKPAIVTDTHCIRLVNRMGLVDNIKEPKKVEMALWKILPHEKSNDFCHRLVLFGRDICTARSPKCKECPIKIYCDYGTDL